MVFFMSGFIPFASLTPKRESTRQVPLLGKCLVVWPCPLYLLSIFIPLVERDAKKAKYVQLLPRLQQAIIHYLSDMKDVPS